MLIGLVAGEGEKESHSKVGTLLGPTMMTAQGTNNLKENVVFETVDRREYIQTSILNPSSRFEA